MIIRINLAGLTLAIAILSAISGCATAPPATQLDRELAELVRLYQGAYLSQPEQGARNARAILLRVVPVTPPAGHRFALYSEMRHDGVADGDIYRQSLMLFDESPRRRANTMRVSAFVDPVAAQSLIDQPGLVADGQVATVAALAAGCEMHFTSHPQGYFGRIDPQSCVIVGKSGQTRHIEGHTLLRADAIEQLERGYDADMQLIFGNPDGVRYVWPRVRPDTINAIND